MKKKMTLEEFNANYHISVMVTAFQDAELKADRNELGYGSVDEISDNLNYILYGPNSEEVLQMDGQSDAAFIDLILEEFEIEGLSSEKDR